MHEKWKILVLLLGAIAKEKGITHWDITIETGIMRQYITDIFNLKHAPGIKHLLKITDALGLDIYIETRDGEKLNWSKLKREAMKNYK